MKKYYDRSELFSLEGGDILNLSDEVLAVGVSQRTQPEAVEHLAERIFADEEAKIRSVLAFLIPQSRAYMHLDTAFTQVNVNQFTVYPGILPSLRIFEVTGKGEKRLTIREWKDRPEELLMRRLHQDRIELIHCGGGDQIAADREQWNDGSNTLCIRPGTVVVYDRNYVTNRMLEDAGIRVLAFDGAELSRGRGGPRCMSLALERE